MGISLWWWWGSLLGLGGAGGGYPWPGAVPIKGPGSGSGQARGSAGLIRSISRAMHSAAQAASAGQVGSGTAQGEG